MVKQPEVDLKAPWLAEVRYILSQTVPSREVWAYGSRVTGQAHPASDLDLVLRNPEDLADPCQQLSALRGAFVRSALPIRVDVVDWARIPVAFQEAIARQYVVIQQPKV